MASAATDRKVKKDGKQRRHERRLAKRRADRQLRQHAQDLVDSVAALDRLDADHLEPVRERADRLRETLEGRVDVTV